MQDLKEQFSTYFDTGDDKLDSVISLFDKKHLNKGQVFIRQGDICKYLAFVKQGIMRVSTVINGKEITQWIATKGYYITDLAAFITGGRSRWTITALNNTTIYSISKSDYEQIGKIIPDWNIKE